MISIFPRFFLLFYFFHFFPFVSIVDTKNENSIIFDVKKNYVYFPLLFQFYFFLYFFLKLNIHMGIQPYLGWIKKDVWASSSSSGSIVPYQFERTTTWCFIVYSSASKIHFICRINIHSILVTHRSIVCVGTLFRCRFRAQWHHDKRKLKHTNGRSLSHAH
jgi:hypothetical protein